MDNNPIKLNKERKTLAVWIQNSVFSNAKQNNNNNKKQKTKKNKKIFVIYFPL